MMAGSGPVAPFGYAILAWRSWVPPLPNTTSGRKTTLFGMGAGGFGVGTALVWAISNADGTSRKRPRRQARKAQGSLVNMVIEREAEGKVSREGGEPSFSVVNAPGRPRPFARSAKLGLEAALRFLPPKSRESNLPGAKEEDWSTMKRTFRRDDLNEPGHPGLKAPRSKGGSKGPWEFTSSGRLFSVGASDGVRRTAYRGANGEMRFLPL